MGKYVIVYDWYGRIDDFGDDSTNNVEEFVGTWKELQEYICEMRINGCYNIDATFICDVETMEDGDDAENGE